MDENLTIHQFNIDRVASRFTKSIYLVREQQRLIHVDLYYNTRSPFINQIGFCHLRNLQQEYEVVP